MQTHVQEVTDTLEERRERYHQDIRKAAAVITESATERRDEFSRYALDCLDDVLDSAIERHTRFAERALSRRFEVQELAEFDQYLLGDIARTIEYADGMLERFLRLWEGLR